MGVRRAVEMALDIPRKQKGPIFTFGPLIHNPQVLDLLNEKGISIINDIPEKGVWNRTYQGPRCASRNKKNP